MICALRRLCLRAMFLLAAAVPAAAPAGDWREQYREFYRLVAAQAVLLQEGPAGDVVVVADPACSHCAVFEERRRAGELAGYTVRLVLVDFLAPESGAADRILCAPDPAAAYQRHLRGGGTPAPCASSTGAIHRRIAEIAEIWATPSFLTPGARSFTGLPPAGRLRAVLDEGQL
ncbi:MAG: hypothetical protein ISN26_03005 [Betaproteobacteria bacterium AqS2]|uniref:Thioredoxin-like fold domain-containing protein n=1 Tax=Candidatus Amphirhobacter heronislandensis TaxID=1732024 RepID=A0A930UEE2_9GAMM|nr:hypothetical protein [Betaproteobacteria bacterium AqS2]